MMLPPKGVTNAPKIHAITRITAIMYNKLLIIMLFSLSEYLFDLPFTKIIPKKRLIKKALRAGLLNVSAKAFNTRLR
jgi:hypothetical protein